jgi:hypothetical protein
MQGPNAVLSTVTYPVGAGKGQRITIDGPRGAIFEYDASNNLVGSWASKAGTDPYGHSYPEGFSISGSSIIEGVDFVINQDGAFYYNGTPAAGNLILSLAAVAGSDTYGNPYPAGLGVTEGNIAATLIGRIGTLNPNPYFTGGDATTWFANSATSAAVTSTPPSPAPYPYAYQAVASGAANFLIGQLKNEGTGEFAITPDTQYLVTGWIYSTEALTFDAGLDWLDSSFNITTNSSAPVTVPANTWTQFASVVTSPASGSIAARVNITAATTPAAGTDVYVAGVTVFPQVPGTLIQAGSITASQIAAGIIIAGIVDGTTITGAQIVADGSSGNFLVYSGTPAAGNLIASMSPLGGTDSYGNHYPSGLMFGGTTTAYFQVDDNGVAYFYNASGTNIIRINPSRQAMYLYDSGGALLATFAAVAGTDPLTGASYPIGVTVGNGSHAQVQLTTSGGAGVLNYPLPSSSYAAALMASGIVGSGSSAFAQLLISGPNLTAHPDWISHELNSSTGSNSANEAMIYNTPTSPSTPHQMAHVDNTGFNIDAGSVTGAAPGSSPASGDGWHGLGVPSGWTGHLTIGGTSQGGRYYKAAEAQAVWVDIFLSAPSGGASSATFPYSIASGWLPSVSRFWPAALNGATAGNARIYVNAGSGAVQILGLPSGYTGEVSASFMMSQN